MITLTIFPREVKIYTRELYYLDVVGFSNSDQEANYVKIQNFVQKIEFFVCDYYLNTDLFQIFTFLKKVGDLVFIEFNFENEKEFAHFLRTNPAFEFQYFKRITIDNENNIYYILDLDKVAIVYEYEEVELL